MCSQQVCYSISIFIYIGQDSLEEEISHLNGPIPVKYGINKLKLWGVRKRQRVLQDEYNYFVFNLVNAFNFYAFK